MQILYIKFDGSRKSRVWPRDWCSLSDFFTCMK